MKFTSVGVEYDVDLNVFTAREAIVLKKATGVTMGALVRGISDGDGEAFAALLFIAKRRAREVVRWEDLMDVDLVEIMTSIDTSEEKAESSPETALADSGDVDAHLKDG